MTLFSALKQPHDKTALRTSFYLDLLTDRGINVDTLTAENVLALDLDIIDACEEIEESVNIADYERDAAQLLEAHPTNLFVLSAVASARCIDEVSIRAALALREISSLILDRPSQQPLDDETRAVLATIGAEVLFEFLLLTDNSNVVFDALSTMLHRYPEGQLYLWNLALRTAAVFEINRYNGETTNAYTIIRDRYVDLFCDDPEEMRSVQLAEIVYIYIRDSQVSDDLQARINTFCSSPLTESLSNEIANYSAQEPVLDKLIDSFPSLSI